MSKKKDDFEFNWDDDASFDSELDKFDGDVGEFYGDDVDDAEKNRSPVTKKLKSILLFGGTNITLVLSIAS